MHLPSRDAASSHQASSPASLTKDGVLRPGSVVEVLPGRQFPSFCSGDLGVVKRVDEEARTCDVLFDHGAGPLTVATRHLKLSQDYATLREAASLTRMETGAWKGGAYSPKASRSLQADIEVQVASQQHALISLEARLVACEAALSLEDSRGKPAGRLVAARVAALEGAHQSEVNELRRALTEAVGLSREQETLHRKHRTAGRELEQLFHSLEQRCESLQNLTRRLETELSGLTAAISSHERRAANLQDVVASSSTGLSDMAALLEGQERRTFDLSQALSTARKELLELGHLEAKSFSDRREKSPAETRAKDTQETDAIWKALRDLQELVVHESEHRAAGLREVLGVVGKDAEQLRGEQARHETEIEGRCKAEALKVKHHINESQVRISEYEKQTSRLDKRLEALSQALSAERNARIEAFVWLESQVRDAQPAPPSVAKGLLPSSPSTRNDSPTREEGPGPFPSTSLKRLQALEVRFDRKSPQAESQNMGDQRPAPATATEETLEKLRGQLDVLRAELKVPGAGSEATATLPSPRSARPAEVRMMSPARLVAAQPQPRVVYSYHAVAAPSAQVDGLRGEAPSEDWQPKVIYPCSSCAASGVSASLTPGYVVPKATVGIDLNKDGKADVLVSGADLNNDGIPDCLQSEAVLRGKPPASPRVTLCTGPAKGYVRPTDSIATFGQQA